MMSTSMRQIVFELCAETVEACLAARDGGASRVELCSGLSEGGLTPSHGLIAEAVRQSGLPIHVLIRPRGGNFQYSANELEVMMEDVQHAKQLKAAGVVLGVLTEEGTVDVPRTQALVDAARPMKVTFHRAFDEVISLPDALEDVIAIGCDRILTSGGHRDVVAGAAMLKELVTQARGRVEIAVGGGLRLQSAASVARLTDAEHFHGSLRRRVAAGGYTVDADEVRTIIKRLEDA